MLIRLLVVIGALFLQTELSAQYRRVFHETFEVSDSIDLISFDLAGDIAYETWSGNVIMTETAVELMDASTNIFDHFEKIGRYDILVLSSDTDSTKTSLNQTADSLYAEAVAMYDSSLIQAPQLELEVFSKDKIRESIQLRRNIDGKIVERTVQEWVQVRVFIPEVFESKNENNTAWQRKSTEEEEKEKQQSDMPKENESN